MTTIVGVQGSGWAVIAGDSRVSTDRVYSLADTGKVVNHGEIVIASCGDLRGVNLLAHAFKPPAINGSTDMDEWITMKFIPALRKCYELHGYEKKENEVVSTENEILVAARGIIYEIGDDYSWIRDRTGLYGLGSGGDIALGALAILNAHVADTPEEAAQLASLAVEVASRFDPATGRPVSSLIQHTNTPRTAKGKTDVHSV